MLSNRKLDRIAKNLDKPQRDASNEGTIYGLFNNYADVRMGNSPTLLKNVTIQGNSDTLYVGKKVRVEWAEKEGNPHKAPYISGGAGDFISGQGGGSTVTVDDVTIIKGYTGLAVKKGGLGLQHLNFTPAVDGHTHKTPLELGGWKFTDDGIMYTDKMYIHPLGMMKIGGGYPNEDDIIILDSNDTTYRLWAGNQSAASAPFSVSKAGAIKATSGQIAGWTIDASKIAGGGIEMYSAGYIQSNPFTSGFVGFRIDDDVAEFNNVRVRGELHSAVFVYDEIHASAGTFGVFPSAGVLLNDVTTTAGSFDVDIKDPDSGHAQLFSLGHTLRIKDGSGYDNWLNITGVSDQTTFWRYTCTKDSGSNTTFRAGATVVSYGGTNYGFITLSADGAIGSSPNISLATHTGSPWSSINLLGRIGNLNGSYGISANDYGFGFGDYADDKYIRYDDNTGELRISGTVSIGSGLGVSLPAVVHLPFDGPAPIKSNFNCNTATHLGLLSEGTNPATAWFGKWHKSVRSSSAHYNWVYNPRFELNTTDWAKVGTGSMARSTAEAFIGSASLAITAGSSQTYARNTTATAVPNGSTVLVQCRILNKGGTGADAYFTIRDVTTPLTRTSTYSTATGDWEYLTAIWYNDTGVAKNVEVRLVNSYDDSSTVVYFDAVQVRHTAGNVGDDHYPYTDGGMPTASWLGTAHNSVSDCGGTNLKYTGIDFPYKSGSISMWVKPTFESDDNADYQYLCDYGYTGGLILYIRNTNHLTGFFGGTSYNFFDLSTGFDVDVWHHIVMSWDEDADEFTMYLDGAKGANANYGTWNPDAEVLYVGSRNGGSSFRGYIDDFALIPRRLTDVEVSMIYSSDTPLSVSARDFGLFLAEDGVGKVIGDAAGISGYASDDTKHWNIGADGIKLYAYAAVGSSPGSDFLWYNTGGTRIFGYLKAGYYGGDSGMLLVVDEEPSGSTYGSELTLGAMATGNATDGATIRIISGVAAASGRIEWEIDALDRMRLYYSYLEVITEIRVTSHIHGGAGITIGSATQAPMSSYGITMKEETSDPGGVSGYGTLYYKNDGFPFLKNESSIKLPLSHGYINLALWGAYLEGTGITTGKYGTYHPYVSFDPNDYNGCHWSVNLPPGWGSKTIYVNFHWTRITAEAAANVYWVAEATQHDDGVQLATSVGVASGSAISTPAQYYAKVSQIGINLATATVGEGDGMAFSLKRYGPSGSDTFTGWAQLLDISLSII
jgi:hypothetical protein